MKTVKPDSKPVLFSAPMVRALLDGSKTQTRRIIKGSEGVTAEGAYHRPDGLFIWTQCKGVGVGLRFECPHPVGSFIWCKETWRQAYAKTEYSDGIVYRADREKAIGMDEYSDRHIWKPSIFMPRKFSRITLEVTAVKVERLNDISEEDAKAEGVSTPGTVVLNPKIARPQNYTHGYQDLWESINGKGSWSLNPWVFCCTFKRIKP